MRDSLKKYMKDGVKAYEEEDKLRHKWVLEHPG